MVEIPYSSLYGMLCVQPCEGFIKAETGSNAVATVIRSENKVFLHKYTAATQGKVHGYKQRSEYPEMLGNHHNSSVFTLIWAILQVKFACLLEGASTNTNL